MTPQEFHEKRQFVETSFGRVAYVEKGEGPVALFVHGYPLNGFHWRHVIDEVSKDRRCIALDLLGLGYSEPREDFVVTYANQAAMIGEFADSLDLREFDLIGNDSGGAICQIAAANDPARIRTLTLTNCEAHTNNPPEALKPLIELSEQGVLADMLGQGLDDLAMAQTAFATAFEKPEVTLTAEVLDVYVRPLVSSAFRKKLVHDYCLNLSTKTTAALEPKLKQFKAPTLIVWSDNDEFMAIEWAHWLKARLVNSEEVVTIEGGKLFFPEERHQELVAALRPFLAANAPQAAAA
jgi:pimeloyl-ACP methyl ester carboxylesterase